VRGGVRVAAHDHHARLGEAELGAFGALALGIGTSEVEHVLATQCLVWSKPETMEARVTGTLAPGVTAKDLILALIGRIGTAGAKIGRASCRERVEVSEGAAAVR